MRSLFLGGIVLGWTAGGCAPALAAPPPDADPRLAPWFQGLTQPGTNKPCCSLADCRPVQYRVIDGHFQAFIGDEFPRWSNPPHSWVDVPDSHVLHRPDNPTGEGVACWFQGEVVCFIEGPGT